MTEEIFSFTIYMIHELSRAWGMLPSKVYEVLKQTRCIDDYFINHYDVLHTLGTEYLEEDIREYVTKRGVKI